MTATPLQFCGYEVHQYALRRYGAQFCADRIAQVEYCIHGDRCEDCCFLYTGRLKVEKVNHQYAKAFSRIFIPSEKTRKKTYPFCLSPRSFFYQLMHGYDRQRPVHPGCSTKKCVAPSHMIPFFPLRTSEDLLRRVHLCPHGRLCEKCDWPWFGNTHRSTTGKSKYPKRVHPRSGFFTSPMAWLLEDYCGKILPDNSLVIRTCRNKDCFNFWHLAAITYREQMAYAKSLNPNNNKALYAHNDTRQRV